MVMKQKFKLIFYGVGALILLPQSIHAQFVNMEGLDSLRLSGSVSVVEPELLKKGVLHNALDALSGQTAGVNVTTNGLDRIAMLNAVRVRGTTSIMGGNEPLVIIDGVTSDVATLATIYPADIESFTVLKNASETALYGSRGASGVIQVKTKRVQVRDFRSLMRVAMASKLCIKVWRCSMLLNILRLHRSWDWNIMTRDMIPTSERLSLEQEISKTIIWLSVVEIHRATIALLLVILIIIPSSVVRGIAI